MKLTRGYHFCVAQDHVKNLLNSEKELRLVKFETRAIYFSLSGRVLREVSRVSRFVDFGLFFVLICISFYNNHKLASFSLPREGKFSPAGKETG